MIATTPSAVRSPVAGLLSHHYAQLVASGLTDATIKAAGLYSEANVHKIRSLIGCSEKTAKGFGAVLAIPFADPDGRHNYCRIRPDTPRKIKDKPVKYESPVGQPNAVYLPPGVRERMSDTASEILITEGEKKALAANQEGFPTIGLVGVHGWKTKSEAALLPTLERVAWQGRPVYIAFDSDISEKPAVQHAETWLAHHLRNRGAIVKVLRLPDGPAGEDGKPSKVGLDDYLLTHGAAGLRALLDNAHEPADVVGEVQREHASKADPCVEARHFLDTCRHEGALKLRFWSGSFWYWRAGKYVELPSSEVRAQIVLNLNHDFTHVGAGIVSNTLEQVRAQTILSSCVQPPQWIDQAGADFADWRAHDLVVARNGVLHLPSLVAGRDDYLAEATPSLFATTALDYPVDLGAPAPVKWLEFLNQIWPNDPESLQLLQEWIGYLLVADTQQQKILLLVGPKRSGKGTIARVMRAVVGEGNCCAPTLASLSGPFGLWPLLGKTAAIISDARLSGRADGAIITERLLSISGEDAQTVDRKNLESITTKLMARFTVISNELPRLNDTSGALAGRMLVLRMQESFFGREDHDLTEALLTERPGILLWAIEGWRRLRERGRFVQPASSEEMREAMDELSSPVGAFVRDCCEVGDCYSVAVAALYEAWQGWCRSAGRDTTTTEQTFCRDLLAVVPRLKKVRPREGDFRYRAYHGIGLKN